MKKLAITLSVSLFALFGCVDRDFDIADASGEVTLGGEELVLPLATLDKITLDKFLSETDMVKTDDAGNYQIHFSSFGDNAEKYETFTIEGVKIPVIEITPPVIEPVAFATPALPTLLNMSAIRMDIPINYPTIGSAVEVAKIDVEHNLSLGLPISGAGVITDAMLSVKPELAKVNLSYSDQIHFEAEINVLKEFKNIDFVEFGCEKHPFGAPIEITLDLNGVTDINGGGALELNVAFPEGYYLRDESGNDYPIATHNIVKTTIPVSAKQRTVKFITYLNRIDYGGRELTQGVLEIKDDIIYDFAINLAVTAGTYDMSAAPKFAMHSQPEYKDIEVILQDFEVPAVSHPVFYSFNGLNGSVSIEKIAFSSAPMLVKMTGLEWFGADVGVELQFPSYLHVGNVSNGTMRSSGENVVVTTLRKLEQGITLDLRHIDATDSSICKHENGQLVLEGEVVATLDLSSVNNHKVLLSTLMPPTPSVNIGIHLSESTLTIDTANSVIKTVANEAFDFNLEDQLPKLSHTIEMPSQVVSVKEVDIRNADDTTKPVALTFSVAPNGASFPVSSLDVDIAVNLGKLLRPTQASIDSGVVKMSENGDYLLVVDEVWDTSTAISKRVEFEALQNLPKIEGGKITIEQSFPVTGSVAIKSGEDIILSGERNAAVKIDIAVDDIKMTKFTGALDVGFSAEAMSMDLGELSNVGLNIGAMTINPVLAVNIKDNTTGVPLLANATLRLLDGEGKQMSAIETPVIPIAAQGATNIILSTPKNESLYSKEGVTFVAVEELSKLLDGGVPAKVVLDMKVASDKEQDTTIDLTQIENGVNLDYQYEVTIPLSFDGALNISYESQAMGLNGVFAEIASVTHGLTVNDVSLLAEFGTNIPFDMIVTAELVNANGTTDGIDAKLNIEECVIKGYTPEYGEKRTSNIILNFDLGDTKSLESLKSVDGLRFKFTICNTGQDSASLNKSQFLDGKVKLRLRDGVSVDIFELLKEKSMEE